MQLWYINSQHHWDYNTSFTPISSHIPELYEVRYRRNGPSYTFGFVTLMHKFCATDVQVINAIAASQTTGEAVSDGPLKGIYIRMMTPDEARSIREAYLRKTEPPDETLQLIIGRPTPDSIW